MADITLKIHEGTGKLTGKSLCKTCISAQIWTDEKGEHTMCASYGMTNKLIYGKVLKCNEYKNEAIPMLADLKEIAWTLDFDKKGVAGFHPPAKD